MTKNIFAIGLMLISTLGIAADCPLLGDWKSDRKKALISIYSMTDVPLSQKSRIARQTGKMVMRYTSCNEVVITMDGHKTTHNFELVSYKNNVAVIKDTDSKETSYLIIDGDCYSTRGKEIKYTEFFCKV